jgi:hypothetical protein
MDLFVNALVAWAAEQPDILGAFPELERMETCIGDLA